MIVGVIIIETVLDATAIFGAGSLLERSSLSPDRRREPLDRAATETVLLDLAANQAAGG